MHKVGVCLYTEFSTGLGMPNGTSTNSTEGLFRGSRLGEAPLEEILVSTMRGYSRFPLPATR